MARCCGTTTKSDTVAFTVIVDPVEIVDLELLTQCGCGSTLLDPNLVGTILGGHDHDSNYFLQFDLDGDDQRDATAQMSTDEDHFEWTATEMAHDDAMLYARVGNPGSSETAAWWSPWVSVYADNDTLEHARHISVQSNDQTTVHAVLGPSDVDAFRVQMQAGDKFVFDVDLEQTDSGEAGTLTDTILQIYDCDGNLLDFNDDFADPDTDIWLFDPTLLFVAETSGAYTIVVLHNGIALEPAAYTLTLKHAGSSPGVPVDAAYDDLASTTYVGLYDWIFGPHQEPAPAGTGFVYLEPYGTSLVTVKVAPDDGADDGSNDWLFGYIEASSAKSVGGFRGRKVAQGVK